MSKAKRKHTLKEVGRLAGIVASDPKVEVTMMLLYPSEGRLETFSNTTLRHDIVFLHVLLERTQSHFSTAADDTNADLSNETVAAIDLHLGEMAVAAEKLLVAIGITHLGGPKP